MKVLLVITNVSGGSNQLGLQGGKLTLGVLKFPDNAVIDVQALETVEIDKHAADAIREVVKKAEHMAKPKSLMEQLATAAE